MNFLKAVGIAFLSAFITALAFFGGFVVSVISAIFSFIGVLFLAFLGACLIISGISEDKDKQSNRVNRS